MTECSSAALSTTGRRDHNEDSFIADDTLGLYAVADGVGGHTAGEVASAAAIAAARAVVTKWREEDGEELPTGIVGRAVEEACAEVYRIATTTPGRGGMATTLTMLLVDGNIGHMAHVGDSRLYLVRDRKLEQLSSDHTLAEELYRAGVIPRERVEGHPQSSSLTRSCGSQRSVMVETLQLELHPDDVYVLSSDGLNPAAAQGELVVDALAPGADLAAGLRKLVEEAGERGSTDNITAVALRVAGKAPEASLGNVAALRGVPLFEHLSTADLARIAVTMKREQYAAGDVLVDKGARTGKLFVVLSGQLRWELDPGQFGLLDRGHGIGGSTLMSPRSSPGRLSAERDAVVLALDRDAFRRLVRRRERLGVALLSALAEQLSDWIDPDTDRGVARPPHGLLIEF